MAKQFGLGKGLGALIPDNDIEDVALGVTTAEGVRTLPLSRLKANPDQPRRTFSEESLADLASSLKTLQPYNRETSSNFHRTRKPKPSGTNWWRESLEWLRLSIDT